MPNNFARLRAGFIPVAKASVRAKRRDVATTVLVQNKGFAAASQELGSPNGGPGPTYSGGGGSHAADKPGFGGVLP
jgi:hypothetical protein